MQHRRIRVGLFGFGRAGQAVAQELINDPHIHLCWVATRSHTSSIGFASEMLGRQPPEGELISTEDQAASQLLDTHPVDFVVDFSSDATLTYYGRAAAKRGIGIVSAVSHYGSRQIEALCDLGNRTRVLYSPNITLGVNFMMVAAQALKRMAPQADIEIIEQHFRGKTDISGTALRLADSLGLDVNRQVNSIRVGGIVGKHEVIFGFPYQTLRLVHESISRNAFGQGALYAVKRLANMAPGYYTMDQLIRDEFHSTMPA